jgi:perosamine synthetase
LTESVSQVQTASPAAATPEFIPLIVPEIRGHEWDYIKECLDTNWVSSVGTYVERFEKMVAERAGAQYAVATVNGTSALHIALLLAGVQPDDEVLTSTLTFIAPANAIRYVGAWPIFLDADPVYWQIDPVAVKSFLENDCQWDGITLRNRHTNRRIGAILPVHILGHPADIQPILDLAATYSLPVIEDATESLGSRYRGRSPGSLAHVGCFSFNGNKIITTGGGGMLVTDNSDWAARAKYLSTQAKDDPIEYIHNTVGYNYRMTNMLAAMGCAQIEQLDEFVEAKRKIAARYLDSLAQVPGIHLPQEAEWATSSFWMFTVLIDENVASIPSRELLRELSSQNIQTRPLWQPMHQSRAHSPIGSPPCPNAEALYRQALSLPCSVGLTWPQQSRVIDAIAQILKR